jgi:hypothetical protein
MSNNPAGEISQVERQRVMAEERRLRTYAAHAQANLDEDRQGRFAALDKPNVIGTTSISYPAQPEKSHWRRDPVPDESPLGYSVDQQEAVGEVHEVAASQNAAEPSAEPTAHGQANGGVRRKFRRRI